MDFISLKDAVSHIVDNRGKTCPTSESGIPLIATNCVKSTSLYPSKDKIRYVDAETYETWFRGHPEPGDILFVNKGSPGEVCLVPDPVDFCIAQDMVSLRANEKKIDPSYLFAVLRDRGTKVAIENMHVGTMIPHFKKTDFDKLNLPLPTRSDQQFIGELYLGLSKRIALNQKMNQTLEEIAKAIFKSWFVDFDPVRAKAEGRPTGLPTEISDLFPDEVLDSEVGEIPKGWELAALDQIGNFRNGLALQKYPAVDSKEKLPVVKIAQLRKGSTNGDDLFASDVPSDFVINDGDYVFSWSGSLMAKYWVGGKGALNQHLFKVEEKTQPLWFIAGWVEHFMPEFQSIAESKATTMGHIKREHLKQAICAIPSHKLMKRSAEVILPLIERSILSQQEVKVLSELRDTLLPKLISGELRIPDAEKFLEDAGI